MASFKNYFKFIFDKFQEINKKHLKLMNKGFVSESGAGLSGDDEGKTEVTEDVTVTTRR